MQLLTNRNVSFVFYMIVDQLCISCHRNLKLSPIVTVEISFGFLPGVVSCKDVSMSTNIVHKIRHLFKSEGMLCFLCCKSMISLHLNAAYSSA